MEQSSESIRAEWKRYIQNMFNEDDEIRCISYQYLKDGFNRGLRIKDPFNNIVAERITSESYTHLQSLLELVEAYFTSHRETLLEDFKCYPIFKALIFKYHEHVGSCLNLMFLNHALINLMETFPSTYTLIMALKLFGEPPVPISVTQKGLYVAQAATQVTGVVVPLITPLTPFETLRAACINLMDIRNTYKSYPQLDIYQWSEDLVVALWYLNRPEMMRVFKSLPTDIQNAVILMIKNYGTIKYESLSLEMKPSVETAEIIEQKEVNTKSTCDKCDWSTRTISAQETLSVGPSSMEREEIPDKENIQDNLPTQTYFDSKCDISPLDVSQFKGVREKKSTVEEPQVDATKSEIFVFTGSKVAARESILNLLKHPSTLPASNEDLTMLALQMNKEGNQHELLYENKQNQRGMQENVKIGASDYNLPDSMTKLTEKTSEEQEQEELSDDKSPFYVSQRVSLQSTSDMNRESCEEIAGKLPQIDEESAEEIRSDMDYYESEVDDLEDELEEVQYDTTQSEDYQTYEELSVGTAEGKHKPDIEMECDEPVVKQKKMKSEPCKTQKGAEDIVMLEEEKETDNKYEAKMKSSFLPHVPAEWEESECKPSSSVATASESASTSKLKTLKNIPSKITSLFRGRGFKSQTTISEENVGGPDSTNSRAKMYTEAWKILRVEIEGLNSEIYNCKIEINATEFEIEQLRNKIRYNNMLIHSRQKKSKGRFSAGKF